MAFHQNEYWYDQQIKNYVLQFMAIFAGVQVQVGKWGTENEQLITVPIHYGHQDRVVAAIMAENTQNKPIRLPAMSAYIKGLSVAPERMHGTGQERRNAYTPVGGLFPDDVKVVHQRMPVPYDMEMELFIYVSNTEQHFQILEQIMPLFDPQMNLQTSDAPFDWSRLNYVELTTGPTMNTNYPSGTDSRIIQSSLTFRVPIQISIPAVVKNDIVKKIFVRIGAVGMATQMTDIVAELDAEGTPYQLQIDGTQVKI